jgi:uncharacterized protein (DUF2147 family)
MLALSALLAVTQLELSLQGTVSIEGEWRNPQGTVIISIAPCGDTTCGRVQWASEQAKADARKGGTDPLVGAELLKEIVSKGDGRWRARLFVPDLNKTSKAELRLLGPDRLKVTGCLVGRVACKSQVWTRSDEMGP